MKQWTRITLYLLLNVLISACTTLAVLVLWDRTQSPLPGGLLSSAGQLFTSSAPTAAPESAATPEPATPQPTPTRTFIVYQVKDGDTFDSIAQEHGVTVDELMAENGFTDNIIGVGEVIRIPISPAAQAAVVIIETVIGAGDLASERVVLVHRGDGEISLTGWVLADQDGNSYAFPAFPQLTLYPGGGVNLYTRAGANTVADLFWGAAAALWQSGETVTLRDASGQERATYQVP